MRSLRIAEEMPIMPVEESGRNWNFHALAQSKLDLIRIYMEAGRRREWSRLLLELRDMLHASPIDELYYLEVYHSLVLMQLSAFNRHGLPQDDRVLARFTRLMDAHRSDSKSDVLAELEQLAELYFDLRGRAAEPAVCDPVALVKAYIANHLADDLSLTHLAELAYLHPDYLSRLFKLTEGITLKQYITARKIECAVELLAHTRLSTKTIARRLGFAAPGYFTQMFKRETGMTPQRFRAQI